MRIEIQHGDAGRFRVTTREGGQVHIMHDDVEDFAQARDRAMDLARFTGGQVFNLVQDSAPAGACRAVARPMMAGT